MGMNELLKGQTCLVFHNLMLGGVLLLHTMHQTKQKLIKRGLTFTAVCYEKKLDLKMLP